MNKSKFLTFFFAIFVPQTLLAAYPPNSSGHYLQLDAVQSIYNQKLLVSKEFIEEGDPDLYLTDNLKNSNLSYGVAYKYAFTMDDLLIDPFGRIFIAPGIFYEDISSDDQDKHLGNRVSMKSRYGFKVDVGCDFDYGLSAYLTNGLSVVQYDASWVNVVDLILEVENPARVNVSGKQLGYFYGVGFSFSPTERLSLILEYNRQSNTLKAKAPGGFVDTGVIFDRIMSDAQIVKFGVAVNF